MSQFYIYFRHIFLVHIYIQISQKLQARKVRFLLAESINCVFWMT